MQTKQLRMGISGGVGNSVSGLDGSIGGGKGSGGSRSGSSVGQQNRNSPSHDGFFFFHQPASESLVMAAAVDDPSSILLSGRHGQVLRMSRSVHRV
jgi:hypothetical protein